MDPRTDLVTLIRSIAREIKTDTGAIREENAEIKQDTEQILIEIAKLQARLPQSEVRGGIEGSGFMLQRFLDNLTSYAETVYAQSEHEPEPSFDDNTVVNEPAYSPSPYIHSADWLPESSGPEHPYTGSSQGNISFGGNGFLKSADRSQQTPLEGQPLHDSRPTLSRESISISKFHRPWWDEPLQYAVATLSEITKAELEPHLATQVSENEHQVSWGVPQAQPVGVAAPGMNHGASIERLSLGAPRYPNMQELERSRLTGSFDDSQTLAIAETGHDPQPRTSKKTSRKILSTPLETNRAAKIPNGGSLEPDGGIRIKDGFQLTPIIRDASTSGCHPDTAYRARGLTWYAIHYAIRTKDMDWLDFLLRSGADVMRRETIYLQVLSWEKTSPHERITLLGRYEEVSPLERAMTMGSLEAVKKLVEAGAPFIRAKKFSLWNKLLVPEDHEEASLKFALRCTDDRNRINILKYMLSQGADPQECNRGLSLLHMAAIGGDVDAISVLVLSGADVNFTDPDLWLATPLHNAITWAQVDAVKALLVHGANPNLKARSSHSSKTLFNPTGLGPVTPIQLAKQVNMDKSKRAKIIYLLRNPPQTRVGGHLKADFR